MRSVTPMRAAKTGYIIMSVLLCVLGVVLFVWPGVSVAVIGELLGIGMIVFGAVKVAGYLSRDLFRLAFQYDLAFGVLLMALGIVTLTHPGETIGFLCVVYGILVLSDGLFKVQIAVDAKRFGIDRWWAITPSRNSDAPRSMVSACAPSPGRSTSSTPSTPAHAAASSRTLSRQMNLRSSEKGPRCNGIV